MHSNNANIVTNVFIFTWTRLYCSLLIYRSHYGKYHLQVGVPVNVKVPTSFCKSEATTNRLHRSEQGLLHIQWTITDNLKPPGHPHNEFDTSSTSSPRSSQHYEYLSFVHHSHGTWCQLAHCSRCAMVVMTISVCRGLDTAQTGRCAFVAESLLGFVPLVCFVEI